MNLEDLAKKTISEVSLTMQEQKKELLKEQDEKTQNSSNSKFKEQERALTKEEQVKELLENNSLYQTLNEDFLKRLRERILVLFEGLNSIKKDELEKKLNLTINFLEFLLANIEDKLRK